MGGRALAIAALGLGAACNITIASSVANPSALEHQLLGVYEELDRELVHASSVRGDLAAPAGSFVAIKAEAVLARSLQRFHEDDLDELLAAGCLLERHDASLASRSCELARSEPAVERRRRRVLEDENRARRSVLQWAAHAYAREAGRPSPTAAEIEEIRGAYARLRRDAAPVGAWVERAPGDAVVVEPRAEPTAAPPESEP